MWIMLGDFDVRRSDSQKSMPYLLQVNNPDGAWLSPDILRVSRKTCAPMCLHGLLQHICPLELQGL